MLNTWKTLLKQTVSRPSINNNGWSKSVIWLFCDYQVYFYWVKGYWQPKTLTLFLQYFGLQLHSSRHSWLAALQRHSPLPLLWAHLFFFLQGHPTFFLRERKHGNNRLHLWEENLQNVSVYLLLNEVRGWVLDQSFFKTVKCSLPFRWCWKVVDIKKIMEGKVFGKYYIVFQIG